ncbi:MAG: proteasome accessory factor PafA2 family protein, partial [Pedococcus sp.]
DVANLLKLGTTSLVLAMIEDRAISEDLTVARPVATLQAVSHDPTCRQLVELRDGTKLTAVQLLWRYHDAAERYLQDRYGADRDSDTAEVMRWWALVLDKLERDPSEAARELDWVGKQQVLQGYIDRDGLDWSDARLRAIDIQWSDVRQDKGLFHRLRQAGRFVELVPDEVVLEAVREPPEDTRAYFRGKCLEKYPDQVAAASWDSVIFDVPGHASLQRVPMLEPLRGTKASVGSLLDRSPDAATLLRELASASG